MKFWGIFISSWNCERFSFQAEIVQDFEGWLLALIYKWLSPTTRSKIHLIVRHHRMLFTSFSSWPTTPSTTTLHPFIEGCEFPTRSFNLRIVWKEKGFFVIDLQMPRPPQEVNWCWRAHAYYWLLYLLWFIHVTYHHFIFSPHIDFQPKIWKCCRPYIFQSNMSGYFSNLRPP